MEKQYFETKMKLLAQLQNIASGLLQEFPPSLFLSELQSNKDLLGPRSFSEMQRDRFCQLKAKYGIASIAAYQKFILASLMLDLSDKLNDNSLPVSIVSLYISWLEGIYEDFSTQPDFYYDLENERSSVIQDLGICSGRNIPVGGAWFIERKIMHRKILTFTAQEWQQNLKQVKRARHQPLYRQMALVLKHLSLHEANKQMMIKAFPKLFGVSWCYIIHTAGRNIKEFSAGKMNLAYKNIVELLQVDPSIWGVFRQSWFLDPELKGISPNLTFLWETPLQRGARLYYREPSNAFDIKRALWLSPVRNKMYQEGKYIPKTYFYFWPRQKIIEGYSEM